MGGLPVSQSEEEGVNISCSKVNTDTLLDRWVQDNSSRVSVCQRKEEDCACQPAQSLRFDCTWSLKGGWAALIHYHLRHSPLIESYDLFVHTSCCNDMNLHSWWRSCSWHVTSFMFDVNLWKHILKTAVFPLHIYLSLYLYLSLFICYLLVFLLFIGIDVNYRYLWTFYWHDALLYSDFQTLIWCFWKDCEEFLRDVRKSLNSR